MLSALERITSCSLAEEESMVTLRLRRTTILGAKAKFGIGLPKRHNNGNEKGMFYLEEQPGNIQGGKTWIPTSGSDGQPLGGKVQN